MICGKMSNGRRTISPKREEKIKTLREFGMKFEGMIQNQNGSQFRQTAESFLAFATDMRDKIMDKMMNRRMKVRTMAEKDEIFRTLDSFVQEHRYIFRSNCNLIGGCYASYQISKAVDMEPELEIYECQDHLGHLFDSIGKHLLANGWMVSETSGRNQKDISADVLCCEKFKSSDYSFCIKVVTVNSRAHKNILHYVNRLDFDVCRAVWSPFKVVAPTGGQDGTITVSGLETGEDVGIQMTHPDIIAALEDLENSKTVVLYPSRNSFEIEYVTESAEPFLTHTVKDHILKKIKKFQELGFTVTVLPESGVDLENLQYDMTRYEEQMKTYMMEFSEKPGYELRNVVSALFGIVELHMDMKDEIMPIKEMSMLSELMSFHELYSRAFELFGAGEKRFEPFDMKKEQEEQRDENNRIATLLYSRPDLAVHGNNGIWDKIKNAASAAKAKVESAAHVVSAKVSEVGKKISNSSVGQAIGSAAKAASSVASAVINTRLKV